jgi:hypothetical protein
LERLLFPGRFPEKRHKKAGPLSSWENGPVYLFALGNINGGEFILSA